MEALRRGASELCHEARGCGVRVCGGCEEFFFSFLKSFKYIFLIFSNIFTGFLFFFLQGFMYSFWPFLGTFSVFYGVSKGF